MGAHINRSTSSSWLLAASLAGAAMLAACTSGSETTTGPTQVKCQVELSTLTASVGADGGNNSITVTALPECSWAVSTGVSWLSDLSPRSGQGTGALQFRVAPNPLPAPRDGDIVVNDNQLHVTQAAGSVCEFRVQPASLTIDADGGSRDVAVTAGSGCSWTMASEVPWITFTSPVSASGDGRVGVRIAANTGTESRVGSIVLADQRLTVTQSAAQGSVPCAYQVTLTADAAIAAAGGTATAGVATAAECSWTASSGAAWITIASGGSGRGGGTTTFNVATNTGGLRTGAVTVAGRSFTLTQSAATTPCGFSISPSSSSVAASGDTGSTTVTTAPSCPWTAASNDPWITVTAGASGTGSGPVAFSVAANIGSTRSGSLTVAGQTFTVTQAAAPCAYAIAPTSTSIAAAGGTGSLSVTTSGGCAWTATSNAAWIAVTSGASGAGSGPVGFAVAANTGGARSGTLTVAGQTFTVTQAAAPAPCAYTIAPPSTTMAAAGGTGSVAVSTAAGCAWTAASNAAWIAITSGASGTGNGPVAFSVAANTGGARTGTLTVAGQTFTVTQAAAAVCAYAIAPTSTAMAAAGGSGSFALTTTAGCAWTAVSTASWITVVSGGAGAGNGTVSYSVAANSGGIRSGTITVADRTFTVTQAAPVACAYAIAPDDVAIPALGGRGTVAVTTTAGCAWTATSQDSWITVSSGASGSGSGSVEYLVGVNFGGARTGRVTIAGRTLTVRQARFLGVAASAPPGR